MWMRSSYYGADEFFEIQGDEGFLWVTRATGEMLDLAPVVLYRGKDNDMSITEFTDVDTDWASGFDALVGPLRRRAAQPAPRRDVGGRRRQGAPAVLRRLPGLRHPPAGRPADDHRVGHPQRVGGVVNVPQSIAVTKSGSSPTIRWTPGLGVVLDQLDHHVGDVVGATAAA